VDTTELAWPTWIGVIVEDLAAQARFYRETLGLTQIGSGDGWVHFDVDGKLFELIRRDPSPQYDRKRYQVGFTVDDVRAARAELVARGVEALTEVEGEPGTRNLWCYFRDPEGNVFEVTQWLEPPDPGTS
jgi:2,3-dihydroxy-p-cumate/2,3-dihydroxybenzoate 3,4-dioxygenase